jgi:two-component system cell cycle response regulator
MSDVRSPLKGGRPSSFEEEYEDEVTSVSAPPMTEARLPARGPKLRDRATLTLVTGPSAGSIFTLTSDENTIGRARECSIRIDDGGISRQHARIVRQAPGVFWLEDLEARNGTVVGGSKISKHRLSEGDRLGIGPSIELRFAFTDAVEEDMLRRLYESSVLDALTGAFNRKHFAERLAGELAYARRHDAELSLLMFDLDHFKRINDTRGHLAGDHVLRGVAALVKRTLRAEDIFARYGGEEFAILARGIDIERAYLLGERLRTTVASARIEFDGAHVPVTISVGAASLVCCGPGAAGDALIGKTDERMYAAKRGGRNRTVAQRSA